MLRRTRRRARGAAEHTAHSLARRVAGTGTSLRPHWSRQKQTRAESLGAISSGSSSSSLWKPDESREGERRDKSRFGAKRKKTYSLQYSRCSCGRLTRKGRITGTGLERDQRKEANLPSSSFPCDPVRREGDAARRKKKGGGFVALSNRIESAPPPPPPLRGRLRRERINGGHTYGTARTGSADPDRSRSGRSRSLQDTWRKCPERRVPAVLYSSAIAS